MGLVDRRFEILFGQGLAVDLDAAAAVKDLIMKRDRDVHMPVLRLAKERAPFLLDTDYRDGHAADLDRFPDRRCEFKELLHDVRADDCHLCRSPYLLVREEAAR